MARLQATTTDVLQTLKEGALQCSLCLQLLNDPKILDCLHRFCCDCLDKLCLKGSKTADVIVCPCCRQKTKLPSTGGASKLKSDFVLRDILEQIQMKDKTVEGACGSCSNEGELAKFCKNCQCVVCPACVAQHEKMKILQSHVLISLACQDGNSSDTRNVGRVNKAGLSKSRKCSVHREEILYYQCTTCEDKEICNTCLNTAHRNHVIESFEEIMSGLKLKLKEESALLSELTDSNRDAIKMIENKKREVQQEVEKGKELIDNISKEMIDSIMREKEQLLVHLEEKLDVLSSALTLMGELLQKDVAKSDDIVEKSEAYTSQVTADLSIKTGRLYLDEMHLMSTVLKNGKADRNWIRQQHVRFCPSRIAPSIGSISFENRWIEETSWEVGLIHGSKDVVTGMTTLPSGKLLLAISRETQATYAIISNKDGSLGWRKNVSMQTFPPFTPCYATSLEKNTIVMACRHIVTRYEMSTDRSHGIKIPHGAVITGLAADQSDERIIITHSGKNEVRLYDGELNEARETTVGESRHQITKIVSRSSTGEYLLCDDRGKAFAVEKYSGVTSAVFPPPTHRPKTCVFAAKAICGSSDGSVFVLWSSSQAANVTQYLGNGIPISKFQTKPDAVHMSMTKRNGNECLVICCLNGTFHIYSKSEV